MSMLAATTILDKRTGSPAEEMVASQKRQKTNDSALSTTIQRSELDSALALASLALNSPKKAPAETPDQDREADLSPKSTPDDDARSAPASGPAPVTPGSPTGGKRKRVHFSEEVPERQKRPNASTASRLVRRRRPMMVPPQRGMSAIPPYPPHHMTAAPHRPPMMIPPPPGAFRHHMMYRQWMPHHARRHMPPMPPPHLPGAHGAALPVPRSPVRALSAMRPPPPSLPLKHLAAATSPSSNSWVCDYCNSAAFNTYRDACEHERLCKHRTAGNKQARQPEQEKHKSADAETSRDTETVSFSGCVALSVEPADAEWLSELNCYIRKHCIEAFSATKQDVLKTSKRGRIVLNQVGIRCKFCTHRPLRDKAVAAVSYPTSMAGIYESVKRWQRVHLPACMDVSDSMQATLDKLQNDTVWVPTTRQYWTDSARALGMVDTADGIRFDRNPSIPPPVNWMPETNKPSADEKSSTDPQQSGGFICFLADKEVIPPYVYFLMRQVEPCYFTEADRFVARSKGPVGFAGFQCRHCQGHAGLGKYFPLNSKALSTNSTSQNIHAHLLKCRKSPQGVKDELVYLKSEKLKSPRLVPGWRKTFFERIWERMHGDKVNLNN